MELTKNYGCGKISPTACRADAVRVVLAGFRESNLKGNDMIQAIGESTALAVRGYEEQYRMPGGHLRKRVADRVAIPTRHDGKRHRRLAKLERGAEVFAAWCLILGVAARCPKPGVLVDERGESLTAEDLGDMTGFPAELFELAIEALLDERIGWLVRVPLSLAMTGVGDRAPELTSNFEFQERAKADSKQPAAAWTDQRSDSIHHSFLEPEVASRSADGPDGVNGAVGVDDRDDRDATIPDTIARAPTIPDLDSDEPRGESEAQRINDVQEALFHLSLLGRVSPEIYQSKEVTRRVIYDLWLQLDADKTILDPREAFVEQLKRRVSGEQKDARLIVQSA